MRTAEHMEHRNLERKWRPSLVLGPHLTEGRLKYERRSALCCLRVWTRARPTRSARAVSNTIIATTLRLSERIQCLCIVKSRDSCERSYSRRFAVVSVARDSSPSPAGQGVRRAAIVVMPVVSSRTTASVSLAQCPTLGGLSSRVPETGSRLVRPTSRSPRRSSDSLT